MADTKTLREAADAALAVLVTASSFLSKKARDRAPKVIADLRAALAAQAQAEPVAWKPTEQQILDAAEKAGLWPNTVHSWMPAFQRFFDHLALTAPQPAAQPVEQADERDEEIERLRDLVIRQGTQLERIVKIVRGDPADGCAHSTHDAADLVYGLKMHSDQYAMAVEHEQRAAQPVRQPLTREQEAAPELLAALLELVYEDSPGLFKVGIREDFDVTTIVGAAIAKATGQEGGAA